MSKHYDEDDDFYEYKDRSYLHEVKQKYANLNYTLQCNRHDFAGIGTNKAKRRLNKLGLANPIAKAIRIALEIEDKNIVAKNTNWRYRDKVYDIKNKLILELSELFKINNWKYGIQKSDIQLMSHIIYFEIPTCEQISWHFSPTKGQNFPNYDGEWDEKENMTMEKLEKVAIYLLKDNNLI